MQAYDGEWVTLGALPEQTHPSPVTNQNAWQHWFSSAKQCSLCFDDQPNDEKITWSAGALTTQDIDAVSPSASLNKLHQLTTPTVVFGHTALQKGCAFFAGHAMTFSTGLGMGFACDRNYVAAIQHTSELTLSGQCDWKIGGAASIGSDAALNISATKACALDSTNASINLSAGGNFSLVSGALQHWCAANGTFSFTADNNITCSAAQKIEYQMGPANTLTLSTPGASITLDSRAAGSITVKANHLVLSGTTVTLYAARVDFN